ncbi:MAG: DNA adenine methylase [Ruminococcus sp.]|nr:DNA adenine methylase [Ruminococcus sp.]
MKHTVRPFIKWAGGKGQLLKEIRKKYPSKIDRYCEPFIGGGAVLFDVLNNHNPNEIIINDINAELINTYTQIKYNVTDLINQLQEVQSIFLSMNTEQRKEYFYNKRNRFNLLKKSKSNSIELAMLFIFLNRTCFNGLYRVNKKGDYNVPIGSYKEPLICDTENLIEISKLLQNVTILCGDYSQTLEFIREDTFVYIDPPYRPLTQTASFTSYTNIPFGNKEQIELSKFIDSITSKGAKVIASNSDPKNVNPKDDFFDELYKTYNIIRVPANRIIGSKSTTRKSVNELLICNY